MNNPRSIKQNARRDALPNFRNLGIILRILLISNGLALLQAILQASTWEDVATGMMQIGTLLTPVLLTSLMLLWLVQPLLKQFGYRQGVMTIMVLVVVLTLTFYYFGGELYSPSGNANFHFDETRYALLGVLVTAILLLYFRLRAKMLSRALHDARLQVLRARIRPHFLFNTINAVLGIVRTQPKQAETALEDMADLFRMAMTDTQDLVSLNREIRLSKQYIELEQLRMGDRLSADWQMRDVPDDALIPPLLLQPLLENAVYHGIEPMSRGGCIKINLSRNGDQLLLSVENPHVARSVTATGSYIAASYQHIDAIEKSMSSEAGNMKHPNNKMALLNIRERLDLLFDAEAKYQVVSGSDFYRVEIALPYVKDSPS